jgi:hypothetical protein
LLKEKTLPVYDLKADGTKLGNLKMLFSYSALVCLKLHCVSLDPYAEAPFT